MIKRISDRSYVWERSLAIPDILTSSRISQEGASRLKRFHREDYLEVLYSLCTEALVEVEIFRLQTTENSISSELMRDTLEPNKTQLVFLTDLTQGFHICSRR